MKRRALIKLTENAGWIPKREGGEHTVYQKGKRKIAIPRHNEICQKYFKAKKVREMRNVFFLGKETSTDRRKLYCNTHS